jgi:hypothetical protein
MAWSVPQGGGGVFADCASAGVAAKKPAATRGKSLLLKEKRGIRANVNLLNDKGESVGVNASDQKQQNARPIDLGRAFCCY